MVPDLQCYWPQGGGFSSEQQHRGQLFCQHFSALGQLHVLALLQAQRKHSYVLHIQTSRSLC